MSSYFCLYTLIAVISDIVFYTCEEFEARGSAHGTKYVEEFLCQKPPDIQRPSLSLRVPRLRPLSF